MQFKVFEKGIRTVLEVLDPKRLYIASLSEARLFIYLFSFALHICHVLTVPEVLSQIFHNSNCNNHLYGNSVKMLCCI